MNLKWILLSKTLRTSMVLIAMALIASNALAFEERSPTVGAAGSIDQIILALQRLHPGEP